MTVALNLGWFSEKYNTEVLARKLVNVAVDRVWAVLSELWSAADVADASGVDPDKGETIDKVRNDWFAVLASLSPDVVAKALADAKALDGCPSYDDFRDLAAVYAAPAVVASVDAFAPVVGGSDEVLPVSSDTPNLWAWRLRSAAAARNLIHFYSVQKLRIHSAAIKHHLEVTRKLVMRDGVLVLGSGSLFMR